MKKLCIKAETDKNLNAIQNVLDSLEDKGGRIVLERGTHYSAPLFLRSGINLHLEEGAELKFSDDFSLCGIVRTRWEGTECYALRALIFAENARNIRISGTGTIDGGGEKWWKAYRALKDGDVSREVEEIRERLLPLNAGISGGSGGGGRKTGFLRPPLVQLKECTGVRIEGITLKNSPFWNTHILYSSNVELNNITFLNPPDAPNGDGLDIDSSSRVMVEGCRFDVGDDCLCLKSGMDEDGIRVGKPTNDVTIRDCSMERGHGGIVLGSETSGGIRNITVENCRMSGTDRGIRIKTRRGRGGRVENISLRNIEMDGVKAPIVINMYYRCGASPEELEKLKSPFQSGASDAGTTPVIRKIEIENIRAENIRSSAGFFLGLPESPIEEISIRNFQATADGTGTFEEPAMDLFYTKAVGPAILQRFLTGNSFENVSIEELDGDPVQLIPMEDNEC